MGDFDYEDLYELLRAEKYSTDLQPISVQQLKKIARYFKNKEEFLVRQKDGPFDEALEKIKTELENARRALRDLHDKRERKVISRALFTAKGKFKVKDTTNMLVHEEKLYFALLELLKQSSAEFSELLNNLEISEPKETKALKAGFKKIKLLESVPELMDTKLNRYGPFAAGAVVELPTELADLLLSQSKAAPEEKNETAQRSE